jgi:hypothetical protein
MPPPGVRVDAPFIGSSVNEAWQEGVATMFHPDQLTTPVPVVAPVASPRGRGCLVDGCTCKDARIVSQRRAAFFAAVARRNGQTAHRAIAPDPAWILPYVSADDLGDPYLD